MKKNQAFATVTIYPKKEILDPQAEAAKNALLSLGFKEVAGVQFGKVIRLCIQTPDEDVGLVQEKVEKMAKAFLANPITEDFSVTISNYSGSQKSEFSSQNSDF